MSLGGKWKRVSQGSSNILKPIFRGIIKGYQKGVSPWLGPRCRFVPSCSEFCVQAIEKKGVFKGAWMGIKRLCRCHPLGGHGYDPVI